MSLYRSLFYVLSFSISFAVAACGGEEGENIPEIDCVATPPLKYSEMAAVWAKCTSCHSSSVTGAARANAPAGINFDTFDAAKAEASPAAAEVAEGAMPPGGGLTEDEKQQIYAWAQCGTPQ